MELFEESEEGEEGGCSLTHLNESEKAKRGVFLSCVRQPLDPHTTHIRYVYCTSVCTEYTYTYRSSSMHLHTYRYTDTSIVL